MVFWSDRFRREDEEDIWEELKQKLMNPPSEQEIALKKQQEQAQIEALTDKMFPDIVQPKKRTLFNTRGTFSAKKNFRRTCRHGCTAQTFGWFWAKSPYRIKCKYIS